MKKFLFIVTLCLLVLLFIIQSTWVVFGSAANVMSQVGLQRAREQHLMKDVLVLTYRSSPQERSSALSELQDTLPLWEKTQQGLQVGDASLGLPGHPPEQVTVLLIQVQSDYIPILVALKTILARPEHPSLLQVQILLDHERSYFLIMSAAVTEWQQFIDNTFWQFYWCESGFVLVSIGMTILSFLLSIHALPPSHPHEEHEHDEDPH